MAKTKRILVLIADGVPDSSGWGVLASGVRIPDPIVPVSFDCNAFGRNLPGYSLGCATLELDGLNLYATLDLEINENAYALLVLAYPGVGGTALEEGDFSKTIIEVQHVGLHFVPNPDHRIQTLAQQGMFEIYNKQLRLRHDS